MSHFDPSFNHFFLSVLYWNVTPEDAYIEKESSKERQKEKEKKRMREEKKEKETKNKNKNREAKRDTE